MRSRIAQLEGHAQSPQLEEGYMQQRRPSTVKST